MIGSMEEDATTGKIRFCRGTLKDYQDLQKIDPDTLYFCVDANTGTFVVFLGANRLEIAQ